MKKKLLLSVIVTFLYAVVTLIAVLHHEIWADEAQVWQLCKHLSLFELINHLHNEGHPSLFYLIVMPFAKLTSNIIYMQLICWGFMCFAVFLLFYCSPFRTFTKFSIILSAGFLYFLPVMARSYAILPFLVFLAAFLYSKSRQHPVLYAVILALIANTHAIMAGFVFILFCCFLYDNIYLNKKENKSFKAFIIPSVIIFIGLSALVLQLHDTTSSNQFIHINTDNILSSSVKVFSFFFINAYNKMITVHNRLFLPLIDIPVILSLISLYVACFFYLFKNSKRAFIIAFTGIMFQFAIYIFAYNSHTYVTRIFSAHIILIFALWILLQGKSFDTQNKLYSEKLINILLSIFFILTSYNGINYYIMEIKYNYTGAKEAAEFIKQNISKDSVFLIDCEPYLISLIYYLDNDYNFYSPLRAKYIKYVKWDNLSSKIINNQALSDFIAYYKETKNIKNNIYFIQTYDEEKIKERNGINKNLNNNFKQIFESGFIVENREGYKIFRYIK